MSLTTQFATMISMIIMGIFLGVSIDSYKILLRRKFSSKISKFINDIFFWLIYCIILFLVLFYINEGALRFYVFLAIACGFSIYKSLLESLYITLLTKTIKIIESIYKVLIKILRKFILSPIKWIIMVLYKFANKIYILIRNLIIKICLLIYKVIKVLVLFILRVIWALIPERLKKYLRKVVIIISYYKKVKSKVLIFVVKVKKWLKR
ncbi:MAG: spore cortex biosynthesis protein YabQ [Bacillales bacterium]|jgi:spore cortex biosynthesis protein YabQ|nr:spore cortex biosynthesis protein YabQ [Bacillales bacterium]